MDDLCSEDGQTVRESMKKRLFCSVTVAKISFFVIQLSVWTNEPHTNGRTRSPPVVSEV